MFPEVTRNQRAKEQKVTKTSKVYDEGRREDNDTPTPPYHQHTERKQEDNLTVQIRKETKIWNLKIKILRLPQIKKREGGREGRQRQHTKRK